MREEFNTDISTSYIHYPCTLIIVDFSFLVLVGIFMLVYLSDHTNSILFKYVADDRLPNLPSTNSTVGQRASDLRD